MQLIPTTAAFLPLAPKSLLHQASKQALIKHQ
jgi:hypothetical protein